MAGPDGSLGPFVARNSSMLQAVQMTEVRSAVFVAVHYKVLTL